MESIAERGVFIDNGNFCRESEDFSYMNFSNIDFSKYHQPISFFRSDFRGANFKNVIFSQNNLDRADFISCTFEDCEFKDVDILSSEIKNCVFINVNFSKNKYQHTSIQESMFKSCTFCDEQLLVNMQHCIFNKSEVQNCSFERSTTEDIIFKKCHFINVDLATMHAERHKFVSCKMENVKFGTSYMFGYLYYDTDISKFKTLYRGKEIKIEGESEAKKLLKNNRLFELLNILFIYRSYDNIPNALQKTMNALFVSYNYNNHIILLNILSAIKFYATNNAIPYKCFIDCMDILNRYSFPKMPLESELEIIEAIEGINYIFKNCKYNSTFIESAQAESSLVTFRMDTDNLDLALALSKDFLNGIYESMGLENNSELVSKSSGSWILCFAVSASVALVVTKVVKEIHGTYIEVCAKQKMYKAISKKLDNKNISYANIKNISEVIQNTNMISDKNEDMFKLLSELKAYH